MSKAKNRLGKTAELFSKGTAIFIIVIVGVMFSQHAAASARLHMKRERQHFLLHCAASGSKASVCADLYRSVRK